MACSQGVMNKGLAATKNTMAIKKTSGGGMRERGK